MSEYISKTELKQKVKEHLPTFHHIVDEIIDNMTSADVAPIILCKDCIHYDHDRLDPADEGLCTHRIATETMVKDNHFCGYAVRKEEDKE